MSSSSSSSSPSPCCGCCLHHSHPLPHPPSSIEHILISTQIRCETGPTVVGDTDSDPALMAQLGAKKVYRLGNTFAEYITDWPSRLVLNQLSQFGFRVISMTGAGQTVIWTMAREARKEAKTHNNGYSQRGGKLNGIEENGNANEEKEEEKEEINRGTRRIAD